MTTLSQGLLEEASIHSNGKQHPSARAEEVSESEQEEIMLISLFTLTVLILVLCIKVLSKNISRCIKKSKQPGFLSIDLLAGFKGLNLLILFLRKTRE